MKNLSVILTIILSLTMLASCGKDKKKKNKGEISVSGIFYPMQNQVQLNGYQSSPQVTSFVQQEFQRQSQIHQHVAIKRMAQQVNITVVGIINQYGQFAQPNQFQGQYNPYGQQQQWGGNSGFYGSVQFGQMPQQYGQYGQQGMGVGPQIQPTAVHFH